MLKETDRLSLIAEQISVDEKRAFQKLESKMMDALERLEKKIATDHKGAIEELGAKKQYAGFHSSNSK
jgi:ABC-type phosphate/phosphonate transport system substrate-binding protein